MTNNNEQEKKIIINWILGLISTDGWVSYSHRKRPLICAVTTVEYDWAINVSNILNSIGIETSLRKSIHHNPKHKDCYYVYIKGGLFNDYVRLYGDSKYCSNRKWKLINHSLGYPNIGCVYSVRDNDYLRENYLSLSDEDMATYLRRTPRGIQKQRLILGLKKK